MTVHVRDQGGTQQTVSSESERSRQPALKSLGDTKRGAQAPDPSLRREVGTLDFDLQGFVSLGPELWPKGTGEGGVSKVKFCSAHLSLARAGEPPKCKVPESHLCGKLGGGLWLKQVRFGKG